MRILILGLNYAPEKVGIAVYTTGMAQSLAAMGHAVQVISGQPYYPAWTIEPGYAAYTYTRSEEHDVDVTRAPHYIPARPTGARRMLHHFSFALAAFFPTLYRGITWRPDVVMTVAPSLVASSIASLTAKLAGAPSWLHVQDFEIEAAMATGLLSGHSWVVKLAKWFERRTFSSFDMVSTISPQMLSRLHQKGVPRERSMELRNWADIDSVRPKTSPSPFRSEWNITTPHVALYSGNIANKQGIEIVLAAAKILQSRDDLTFVICGDGPNRATLEAAANGISNIQFHGLQPKERLSDLLSLATVHLLPQLASAADLVLPSKLGNMLASGRPVVATARSETGLAQEVEGCGIVTPPGDAEALAGAICQLIDNDARWRTAAEMARARAEQKWAKASVLAALVKQLEVLRAGIAHPTEAEPETK